MLREHHLQDVYYMGCHWVVQNSDQWEVAEKVYHQ